MHIHGQQQPVNCSQYSSLLVACLDDDDDDDNEEEEEHGKEGDEEGFQDAN